MPRPEEDAFFSILYYDPRVFGAPLSSAAAAILTVVLTLLSVHAQIRTGDGSSVRLKRAIHAVPETVVRVQATTGTLTMTGWDRPDIEIEIVRHAPAATRIEEISADIEEGGPAVRVSAVQRTGQRDPQLTADVTIKAPRTTRFEEARIVSGTGDPPNGCQRSENLGRSVSPKSLKSSKRSA